MGFKRTLSPTFSTPVVVDVPNDDSGFDRSTFTAKFKRPMSKEERTALAAMSNEEMVRIQLVGWKMVDEDTKEDVPFSPAELNAVLTIDPTPLAAAKAFWDALNGVRTKNS